MSPQMNVQDQEKVFIGLSINAPIGKTIVVEAFRVTVLDVETQEKDKECNTP